MHDKIARSLADALCGGMACKAFVKTVTDDLERALSFWGWVRFHAHLGICLGCRRYLSQMKQTVRIMGYLPRHTAPIAVRQELLERFRRWKDTSPVS